MSDPIVDPSDLGTYLGVEVDEARAALILQNAQALCESIVAPLVPADAAVVLDVAVRAFSNPANVDSQAAGPYPINYGTVSGGMWLTKQNKATLRRNHSGGGAFSYDPTPDDAGTCLPPWDQNVTWLEGVPLAEDLRRG